MSTYWPIFGTFFGIQRVILSLCVLYQESPENRFEKDREYKSHKLLHFLATSSKYLLPSLQCCLPDFNTRCSLRSKHKREGERGETVRSPFPFALATKATCIMYTGLSLLRRRANARNGSYTLYPTGEKHTISTFVDQTLED